MRSWGSVYRDRGRWRARAGDAKRTSLGLYDTREEAEAALAEAQRLDAYLVRATGPEAALVAYGRAWLDREERGGRRRGIGQERARFEHHVATAPFARWPMVALTSADVQRWVRELAAGQAEGPRARGQRRSRRTVVAALTLLRAILRAAVEDRILDESPAATIVLPREESTVEDLVYLEAAEVELLRTTTAIPLRSHAAYLVAVYQGLRAGELWGLRWEDVRLGGRAELIVRHSRAGATKSGRVRRVPLLEPARDALERWARVSGGRRGLVWPADEGSHHGAGYDAGWADRRQTLRSGARYTMLGHRWHAGILTRLPIKDLRHTCACHLLRGTWVGAGWIDRPLRMEEVSQWLGHASLTTTERHYARLAPGGLLDVVPMTRTLRAVRAEEG